ncbi:hypothetical protein ALP02_200150 [Pseudomonas coronafaciens pv. garcae]|nr:hypothetical protein ALP02_200150 [Pseudomonas coronafaciens pv. garcae]
MTQSVRLLLHKHWARYSSQHQQLSPQRGSSGHAQDKNTSTHIDTCYKIT